MAKPATAFDRARDRVIEQRLNDCLTRDQYRDAMAEIDAAERAPLPSPPFTPAEWAERARNA